MCDKVVQMYTGRLLRFEKQLLLMLCSQAILSSAPAAVCVLQYVSDVRHAALAARGHRASSKARAKDATKRGAVQELVKKLDSKNNNSAQDTNT